MSLSELLLVGFDASAASRLGPRFAAAAWSVRALPCGPDLVPRLLARAPACVLLQMQAGGPAPDLIAKLRDRGYRRPLVACSEALDVPLIVASIKGGADDFLQGPLDAEAVFDSVSRAVAGFTSREARPACVLGEKIKSRIALTGREVDILRGIAAGATAKEAATKLDLSPRTVEFYRSRLLTKLGARNAADLMRIVME